MTKKANITVKIGEYESQGKTKHRYKTIGRLMSDDKGNDFILLDATVISMQLFALANKDRNDNIICSIYAETKPADNSGISDDSGMDVPF